MMQLLNKKATAEFWMSAMGYSPADNIEGYNTTIPWASRFGGDFIKIMFKFKNLLTSIRLNPQIFGPFSYLSLFQELLLKEFMTNPIKALAQQAALEGETPDIFDKWNSEIEIAYANHLYDLCGMFIKNEVFDVGKARLISTSEDGRRFLKNKMIAFSFLEYNYSCLGLTRLKALKELLISLIVAVTEEPIPDNKMPFYNKKRHSSFDDYLLEIRQRLANIYNENAFNLKVFSESATNCEIGYSNYKIVKGSQLHTVTLRHYHRPKEIKPNNIVLYLPTPLINKPEIFDLAKGKSVIERLLQNGFEVYMEDPSEPGLNESHLGLGFYGKVVHDTYLDIIKKRHPNKPIFIIGYCIGGALIVPYLARRAEERRAMGKSMDIKKVVLMASPVKFDDEESGHAEMRKLISKDYDVNIMDELFGETNVPSQVIGAGMDVIQPGVQYNIMKGFFARSVSRNAIRESAPFIYWLTHGSKYPTKAHREWLYKVYIENQIFNETYCLPSNLPEFDNKPVNMKILQEVGMTIFDYRGDRDPIAPAGSCVSSETWGCRDEGNISACRGGLNRTIEKNIGHIFVVSEKLLTEFISIIVHFLEEPLSSKSTQVDP